MSIRFCAFLLVTGAAALFVGCEQGPSAPATPSALDARRSTAAASPTLSAAPDAVQHAVTMFDACDPETFNAALGAGTCTRSGGVTFAKFIEQLGKHQTINSWHFAPPNVNMRVGQTLMARNRGGEAHTFTEVEEFGGGIVAALNELTGLTTVAPECQRLTGSDFIAPGGSTSEVEDEAGVEKYQCCLHPWMRAEVRITEK